MVLGNRTCTQKIAAIRPWLTDLDNPGSEAFRQLLDALRRNWGRIGSMDQADLDRKSSEQARSILRDNLKRWLLTYHVEAAANLAETRVVSEWREEAPEVHFARCQRVFG